MLSNHTEIIGFGAGICTSISLLPQLFKLLKHKKSDDISLFYLGILFVGLMLWVWYGIKREDLPIIATNGFSLIINAMVMFFGFRYKRSQRIRRREEAAGKSAG